MGFKYELERSGGGGMSKADTIFQGKMNRALRDIGDVYTTALKDNTPRATGKLANSSRFQIKGSNKSQILEVRQGARTPDGDFYGGFVRGGTAPHEIRPKKVGGSLVFQIGGRTIFAKKVNHPGTKANPYHKRAHQQVSGQISEIISQAGVQIAADLME
jgi:hypothetical protein